MTVSPDPKFAVNNYSSVQGLVKEIKIKKEPGTEFVDLSQKNHLSQFRRSPSLMESSQLPQKANTPVNVPHTPSYDPISPGDDDGKLPAGTFLIVLCIREYAKFAQCNNTV